VETRESVQVDHQPEQRFDIAMAQLMPRDAMAEKNHAAAQDFIRSARLLSSSNGPRHIDRVAARYLSAARAQRPKHLEIGSFLNLEE
jgi:hypothetical protein